MAGTDGTMSCCPMAHCRKRLAMRKAELKEAKRAKQEAEKLKQAEAAEKGAKTT